MGVIEDKLKLLPTNPGVYVMLDKNEQVIYVGKAKNLKNRVRQYFFNSVKTEKVMAMVKNIADFYYIIAPSEIDALSLENNLIKKYKPHYNILLKDDKTYPYLKIFPKEDFPTFFITRKIKQDGAKYFGPFMGGVNVNSVLELVNMLFGLRPCDKKLNPNKPIKPCLNYHIKNCDAPCALYIDQKEYALRVEKAIDFMAGNVEPAEEILTKKMKAFAELEDFENALKCRENLKSLEKIKLKRITSLNKFLNADIISYMANGIYSVISILIVRSGRMVGAKNFSFTCTSFSVEDTIDEFIRRYYTNVADIPDEIILDREIEDSKTIAEYIRETFNKNVLILSAKQGIRKQLLDMASINAKEHLETAVDRIKHKNDMTIKACETLQQKLNLKVYPKRMECYDISNISGVDKVGSMVVFIDGEKAQEEYRRFRIKTVEGADDYKSHQEMMTRRLERLITDPEKFPKPDLIIIDGGKGQLSSVKEVFEKSGIKDIELIALAEREEEIYTLLKSQPIRLDKSDYCLKLLQRIRDEAHRFAITYFRSLHGKNSLSSVLDKIDGIGKAKKKELLNKFKDLGGIINATKEELMQVEGVGESLANAIIDTLKKENLR